MSDKNNLRDKISPKAITALIMEKANRSNAPDFIKEAYVRVFDNKNLLTEDWVKRINKWAEDTVTSMTVDEPNIPLEVGSAASIGPLKIIKKIRRHSNKHPVSLYGGAEKFIDCIGVDDTGWKFWFRVYRLKSELESGVTTWPKKGSYVILKKAKIREVKTGITFLSSVREIINVD